MTYKNIFEYAGFLFALLIVRLLGKKHFRRLAKFITWVFFDLLKIRRKTVYSNLKIAFPNLSRKQLDELVYKNYYSFALTLLEILYFSFITKEDLISAVDCANIELVRSKYEEGNGVIFLTGHFANWEIGAASVALHLDIPISVLGKPQRNKYVSDWIDRTRSRFGNKVISLGVSVREFYSALRRGEIVGVVGDQRGHYEGARVKYFNKDTAAFTGTFEIALKLNTPIIVTFVVRQPDNKFKIEFHYLETEHLPEDQNEKIRVLTQEYFNILERYVRAYPEQWFWMHNIWKY